LIGNHDAHYLFDEISACSRYDFKNAKKYEKIYRENKDLFQYAYQEGNHLFTHAGVCTTWYDFFDATLESYGIKKDNSNLADVINKMGTDKLGNIDFFHFVLDTPSHLNKKRHSMSVFFYSSTFSNQ